MCISKPKIPPPPEPPVFPQVPTEVDPSVLAARNRQKRRSQIAFGQRSTILTGGRGLTNPINAARATLLGAGTKSKGASVRQSPPASKNLGGVNDDDAVISVTPPTPVRPVRTSIISQRGTSILGSGGTGSGGGGGSFGGGGNIRLR